MLAEQMLRDVMKGVHVIACSASEGSVLSARVERLGARQSPTRSVSANFLMAAGAERKCRVLGLV